MSELGDFLTSVLTLTVIAGGVWAVWLVIRRERLRRQEGEDDGEVCWNCGYDTRYCRDRCSECGERIPPRPGDYFPLRDEWPAAPIAERLPRGDEIPVVIRQTNVGAEATLIHDQFTARG